MDFSPAQIATMQRFPVGSIVTLGNKADNPKAKISAWTLHTYPTDATGEKTETGLCFFIAGESGDCPPAPASRIFENTPREYNILHGFDSQDNYVSTDNYPYGSLRTTCRWWIETATKGGGKGQQRFMQQTINPKNGRVNKPHASTYTDMQIMYVEGNTGHVKNYSFNVLYGPSGLLPFLATGLFAQLDENEKNRLKNLVKIARLIKGNESEWTRLDSTLKHTRARLNGNSNYTEADIEPIKQAVQEERPTDQYVYSGTIKEALDAVCQEIKTGVKFDL